MGIDAFRLAAPLVVAVSLCACSSNSMAPAPSSSVTIGMPTPAPGSIIQSTPGGIQYFIERGAGKLSVPITIRTEREVPWAVLNVYLFEGDGTSFCGLNTPDAPTWGPLLKGQSASMTISGFQVSRVPCQVTSIRAWLHTRNNGLAAPPTVAETVAQGTLAVAYTIR